MAVNVAPVVPVSRMNRTYAGNKIYLGFFKPQQDGRWFGNVKRYKLDNDGTIREYESPYPGSNIFSLASGGAVYVRDPHRKLVDEQLNGGQFADVTPA
mgnify:CR=1 FL=1